MKLNELEEKIQNLEDQNKKFKAYIKFAIKLQEELTKSLEKSIRHLVGWIPGIGPQLDAEMEKQYAILDRFRKQVEKKVLE